MNCSHRFNILTAFLVKKPFLPPFIAGAGRSICIIVAAVGVGCVGFTGFGVVELILIVRQQWQSNGESGATARFTLYFDGPPIRVVILFTYASPRPKPFTSWRFPVDTR